MDISSKCWVNSMVNMTRKGRASDSVEGMTLTDLHACGLSWRTQHFGFLARNPQEIDNATE